MCASFDAREFGLQTKIEYGYANSANMDEQNYRAHERKP